MPWGKVIPPKVEFFFSFAIFSLCPNKERNSGYAP